MSESERRLELGLARARDPLVGPDLHTNGGAIESLAAEQAWDRAAGEGEIPLARRLCLGCYRVLLLNR